MKTLKIISVTIFMIAFVSISCKKKETSGKTIEQISGSTTYYGIRAIDYYTNGIHYKIFISAKGDIFIVNITSDSLEIKNKSNE